MFTALLYLTGLLFFETFTFHPLFLVVLSCRIRCTPRSADHRDCRVQVDLLRREVIIIASPNAFSRSMTIWQV